MTEEQATYDPNPKGWGEIDFIVRHEIERLQEHISLLARNMAHHQVKLEALAERQDELEERIDRLIVGQRELREQRRDDDIAERIAVALEKLATVILPDSDPSYPNYVNVVVAG